MGTARWVSLALFCGACGGVLGLEPLGFDEGGPADAAAVVVAADGAATATIGAACVKGGELACAGHAQKLVLVCDPTTKLWSALQTCAGQLLCDTREGVNRGSCQEPVAACIGQLPGAKLCVDGAPLECGPDLVTSTTTPCTSGCVDGTCTGACAPGARDCSQTTPRTCGPNGQWQPGAPCTYGCKDGECTGQCIPNTKQCANNAEQTCNAEGEWADTKPCPVLCNQGTCATTCVENTKQCTSVVIPQTCTGGGWVDGAACPFACKDGTCTGVCIPTTRRCTGTGNKTAETCDADGAWSGSTPCEYVCSDGACIGECTPGTRRCIGLVPEVCSVIGTWQAETPCTYVCTGAGTCTGVCSPTSKRCSNTTPETCDASGQWLGGPTCPIACSNGLCTDNCAPGAMDCNGRVPRVCGPDRTWVDGAACPFACTGGLCTGSCVPGAIRCSSTQPQSCGAGAEWQNAGPACPFVCSTTPTLSCTGPPLCADGGSATFGCDRLVFVTSTTYAGSNIGGIGGADIKCDERANASAFGWMHGRHFAAWLSNTNLDAKVHVSQFTAKLQRLDGATVVTGLADDLIDGTIANPISIDENGQPITIGLTVWTGTTAAGTAGSICPNNWTAGTTQLARAGLLTATNSTWTNEMARACQNPRHLYCIEK